VNGWTECNGQLRSEIIKSINPDIVCICESHLSGYSNIQLEGFKWFGHNRPLKHYNSPKTFGGVGIFVKCSIFNEFFISIIDKTFDGILAIKFVNKSTG
jgi:hypothetical protein